MDVSPSAESEGLDDSPVTSAGGEPRVDGDERSAECLAQRDERRVVGGDVLPQRPDPVEQAEVRIAHDGQIPIVLPRRLGSAQIELASVHESPQGARELEVDQMGGVQLRLCLEPLDQWSVRRVADERRHGGGAIEDEHSGPLAIGPDGLDDAPAGDPTPTPSGSRQHVGERGPRRDALDLPKDVVRQREPGGCRSRSQRAVNVVGNVADLDRSRHGERR